VLEQPPGTVHSVIYPPASAQALIVPFPCVHVTHHHCHGADRFIILGGGQNQLGQESQEGALGGNLPFGDIRRRRNGGVYCATSFQGKIPETDTTATQSPSQIEDIKIGGGKALGQCQAQHRSPALRHTPSGTMAQSPLLFGICPCVSGGSCQRRGLPGLAQLKTLETSQLPSRSHEVDVLESRREKAMALPKIGNTPSEAHEIVCANGR
jgi:hypothetical protein